MDEKHKLGGIAQPQEPNPKFHCWISQGFLGPIFIYVYFVRRIVYITVDILNYRRSCQ